MVGNEKLENIAPHISKKRAKTCLHITVTDHTRLCPIIFSINGCLGQETRVRTASSRAEKSVRSCLEWHRCVTSCSDDRHTRLYDLAAVSI